jgi:hypothetical protein
MAMVSNTGATKYFIEYGQEFLNTPVSLSRFTDSIEADTLLNDFQNFPHAYLFACICDLQIKAERAWIIPWELKKRIGVFDIDSLDKFSQKEIAFHLTNPDPLHRFNEKMAGNLFKAIKKIMHEYGGDASRIWTDYPTSGLLVYRFIMFEGIGQKIATMAANILVRDFLKFRCRTSIPSIYRLTNSYPAY